MPERSYTIRPARPDDAEPVTAMWAEMAAQHAAYDEQWWCWRDGAAGTWRDFFVESIADADSIVLVASDAAGGAVGYLLGRTRPAPPTMAVRRRGEVLDMFVRPAHRGRGVGSLLMAAAIETMKSRGAGYVVLSVACGNEEASGFYEKLGLRPVARKMYKRLWPAGDEQAEG